MKQRQGPLTLNRLHLNLWGGKKAKIKPKNNEKINQKAQQPYNLLFLCRLFVAIIKMQFKNLCSNKFNETYSVQFGTVPGKETTSCQKNTAYNQNNSLKEKLK